MRRVTKAFDKLASIARVYAAVTWKVVNVLTFTGRAEDAPLDAESALATPKTESGAKSD